MIDTLLSLNTLLIVLSSGTLIWIVRQVLPSHIEKSKAWKVILRILPVFVGAGLATIPQMRPLDNWVQSIFLGGIAGSVASTTYGFLREALGARVKMILGSKASRMQD